MKVGEEKLKQGAGAAMEQAMADMANPEVMAEMAKMLKDPQFQAQLAAMTKDPSFKNYVSAVSSLLKRSCLFSTRISLNLIRWRR